MLIEYDLKAGHHNDVRMVFVLYDFRLRLLHL